MIKYYGGKIWLGKQISNYLPLETMDRFVDVFVGGGSISDVLSLNYKSGIVNDIDENLINFYKILKFNYEELLNYIIENRELVEFEDVKSFRKEMIFEENLIKKAFMYYTCIYCGYGGKPYASPTRDKYNQYKKRKVIKDFELCKKTLSKCEILNKDYRDIIFDNCFYYLDPPYFEVGDDTYYGESGKNHKGFNHLDFYNYIEKISKNNKIMISYNDHPFLRKLYKDFNILELSKNTVNLNPKTKNQETIQTPELLILNY